MLALIREERWAREGGAWIKRQETIHSYDSAGRRFYTRSPRGLETYRFYDLAGRETDTLSGFNLSSLNWYYQGGILNERATRESRGYDKSGRTVWTQTELQRNNLDGLGNPAPRWTTYLYKTDTATSNDDDTISILDNVSSANDPAYGQLIVVYYEDDDNDGTNNDNAGQDLYSGMYEWYQYDERGRQIVVQKPVYKNENEPRVNVQFKQVFNDEGQVEYAIFNYDYYLNNWSETNYHDTPTTNVTFQFTYDEEGNRESAIFPSGMILPFDEFAEQTGFEENEEEPSDITRTYNQGGLLKSRTAVDIGTINYSYDQFGSLAAMSYFGHTVSYEYDFFGRLKTAADPKAQWNYSYNKLGLKELVTNEETGMREEYEYDALGRVDKLTHRRADNSIEFEADYELGVDGNRIGITETRDSAVVAWDFEYDELGRLTKETRSGSFAREVSYTYDVDSNRISEQDHLNGWIKRQRYEGQENDPNAQAISQRLIRIDKSTDDGSSWSVFETYTWHEGGQLATREDEQGILWTYTWKARS